MGKRRAALYKPATFGEAFCEALEPAFTYSLLCKDPSNLVEIVACHGLSPIPIRPMAIHGMASDRYR